VSYDVAHHGESYRTGFNRVRVYRMTGPPPARPEACFYLNGPDQPDLMSSPSFSPDGSKLVLQYGGGISIADIPDLSGGCQTPTTFNDLIAGAQPDWGPADVPVTRPPSCCAPEQPKPTPGATTDRAPTPKRPTIGLKLPAGIKLAAALRKGISVTVNTRAPGKASATARLKRSKLGSGAVTVATVGTSGKATLRIRLTRNAARSLHTRKLVRITIAVGFTPAAGGAPVKRSAPLTLKR
jgi:hypothetical protein